MATEVNLERPIATGPDDGDVEPDAGEIFTDDTGLWLHEDAVSIWLRFQNVTIPKGATVKSAQLLLQSRQTAGGSSGSFETRIYAIAQDDHTAPANFSQWNSHHNNHTDAFATWDFSMVPPGTTVLTSNFAEAIQEVVDRPGWEPGNAIGIHVDAVGSTANRYQVFQSYEGGVPPVLVVVYETDDEQEISGEGTVVVPAVEAAGDGFVEVAGSGAAALPAVAAAGAGTVQDLPVDGSGEAALPGIVAEGVGGVVDTGITGSGEATIPPLTAQGAGAALIEGVGESALPAIAASGAGTVHAPEIAGFGEATFAAFVADGAGVVLVIGSGEATVPTLAAAGRGFQGELPEHRAGSEQTVLRRRGFSTTALRS